MKKGWKRFWIICGTLFGVGVILVLIAAVLGASKTSVTESNVGQMIRKHIFSNRTYTVDDNSPVQASETQKYQGIRLRILNHSTPQAIQAVREGVVDFAVVTTPLKAKKPLKSISLMEFQEIVVGNETFADIQEAICLEEIAKNPLICLGKQSTTYEFYSKFFLEHNLVLEPDTEVETIDQVLPMIMNGLGIGFLPEPFARNAINEKKVYEIPMIETIPKREICLVENHNFPPSIAAETLKKMLM